ncbi:hypothetical protein HanOQP8_Chr01g0015051 [Helianthus annuus]|nr:hypothetical protein HanOQP8_Chr01g0015051 [Helianthus annuus]
MSLTTDIMDTSDEDPIQMLQLNPFLFLSKRSTEDGIEVTVFRVLDCVGLVLVNHY